MARAKVTQAAILHPLTRESKKIARRRLAHTVLVMAAQLAMMYGLRRKARAIERWALRVAEMVASRG